MKIQHNISSMNTLYAMQKTRTSLQKSLEKLSSGYRINRASDDAAGLAISEKLRFKVTETGRCQRNVDEGLNVTRTADAALQEINDMLKRARGLCVESMNGTFSSQELTSINDEISMLFSEIDRITASTKYNSINLFRRESKPTIVESVPNNNSFTRQLVEFSIPDTPTTQEVDDEGRKFHYEYEERIVSISGTENWGNLDLVSEESFDPASKAQSAIAVIHFDDGIDFNDVNSLVGRSITIGTGTGYSGARTFYFTDGTAKMPNAPTSSQALDIRDSKYNTVEKALVGLCNEIGKASSFTSVQSAVFNSQEKTITLVAGLKDLDDGTYNADGVTYPNIVVNGDGEWANGIKIAYTWKDEVSLDQIDGEDARNNPVVYSTTATATVRLSRLGTSIDADKLKNLMGNSLSFGSHIIAFKDLGLFEGMTTDQFGNTLASKINELDDCSATYNRSTRNLTLTITGLSDKTSNVGDVKELTSSGSYHYDSKDMWTTEAITFNTTNIRNATAEWSEVSEVEVQSNFNNPTAFNLNGQKYIYYNSKTHSLTHTDTAEPWFDYLPTDRVTVVDVADMTQHQIMEDIGSKLATGLDGSYSVNENKITLTANNLNQPMNLDTNLKGEAVHVVSTDKIMDSPVTSAVLGTEYSDTLGTFQKTAEVSFSLGDSSSFKNLVGKGFSIGTCRVEFTDGTSISDNHIDIDISNCSTIEDFKALMQSKNFSNATFVVDDSDKNDIKLNVTLKNVVVDVLVTDGNVGSQGIIKGDQVSYSGGTDVGYSQKEIDFSSITSDNLNDLLGTGFRINCPTCSGEYINVFFCWEKNDSMPTTFSKIDDETGATRTIHNIAVELSKISDISQIAQNIVDQVRPELNHFMDISVGEDGMTLIAKEKRIGDVTDENGNLRLGSIQSGIAANFKYEVIVKKVYDDEPPVVVDPPVVKPDPPIVEPEVPIVEPEEDTATSDLLIYVGSDPSAQYISIHLTYLDLGVLDLGSANVISSDESRIDLLNRIDKADIMISSIRGTIGADENRLEHAKNDLSNYNIQLSDAYSTIRDTDVARETMKLVKSQILTQFQTAMLSQANQTPYHVLQLIR